MANDKVSERLVITMPVSLYQWLKRISEAQNESMASIIRFALIKELEWRDAHIRLSRTSPNHWPIEIVEE